MKLVFMGTPDFAVVTLKALIAAGHEIAAVYSQPPRPARFKGDDRSIADNCPGLRPATGLGDHVIEGVGV